MIFKWLKNIQSLFKLKLESGKLFYGKPHNKKSKSYMVKLFISYSLIIFLCVGIMGILSYSLESQRIEDWTINLNNELLEQYRNSIDTFILGNIDGLSLTVKQNANENPNISYFFSNPAEDNVTGLLYVYNYLNRVKLSNPFINSISIYYKTCDLLISTNWGITYPDDASSPDFVDKDVSKKLDNSNASTYWYFTTKKVYTIAKTDNKNVFMYIRKVPSPDGKFDEGGSIVITVDEEVLSNTIKRSAPVDFGSIFILNDEGMVISHTQKDQLFTNIKDTSYGDKIYDTSKKSGHFVTDINGLQSVVSYTSSEYINWKFVTIKPVEQFRQGLNYLKYMMLIITFITLIFGLILSLFSTRKFSWQLRNLADFCKGVISSISFTAQKDECEIISSTLSMLSNTVKKNETRMKMSLPIMKDHFILSLINASYSSHKEILEKMELLNIDFSFENYRVINIGLGKPPDFIDLSTYEFIKLEVIDKMESMITTLLHTRIQLTQNGNYIVALLNFSNEDINVIGIINELVTYIKESFNIQAYAGIGNVYSRVTNIHDSYQEAEKCIKYSYLYPENIIFTMDDISLWELNNPESSKILFEGFCTSLRSQEKTLVLENINYMINSLRNENYSYKIAMKLLFRYISFIDDFIANQKISLLDVMEGDVYSNFDSIANINDLHDWLNTVINLVFTCIDNKHSDRTKETIQKAKEYMTRNYADPSLSLTSLADAMCISPTYLSHVFKDETGMNFVDYLSDIKLEAARDMLLVGNMTVDRIASSIGYSSPQYFIKKFKSKYGMTPKEYKVDQVRKKSDVENFKDIVRLKL